MIKTNIKLEVLETAVNDYFQAEEEWQMFLKTWQGGWWEAKTAKQREDYTKYNERNSGAWNIIITLCRLLSIDEKSLFAIVKANNRYTKNHGKWDRFVDTNRLKYWQEDNFLNIIANAPNDNEKLYYKSTGRKDKSLKSA